MTGADAREVLAVRYGNRTTTRAENFFNHHLYGEPDANIEMDYCWPASRPSQAPA